MVARVRMDSILWEFGKITHKKYLADNPGIEVSVGVIVMGTLLALKDKGDVVKHLDADGSVTWRATPKFLTNFNREAGPLVVYGPEVH